MRRPEAERAGRFQPAIRGASGRGRALGLALVLAGAWGAGCAAPVRLEPGSPEARLLAPPLEPAHADRQRAALTLDEIPGAPPAPSPASRPAPELPRQALQRLEAARRLLGEHRYGEAIGDLETALRYDARIPEAHRQLALAGYFSGDAERAARHAEQALALQPDDPVCHCVLGRLAERAQNTSEAIRRYRLALSCPSAAPGDGFRVLAHHGLGLLLEREGYYAAAAGQLEAFCRATAALNADQLAENPELAALVRTDLGTAAVRMARARARLGQYGQAADSLAGLVRLAPKEWTIRGEWVRMLARAGRWPEAERAAEDFVLDSQGQREAVELLLAAARVTGHSGRVADRLNEVAALQPGNVALALYHIDALLAAGRCQEASRRLAEVSARHGDRPEVRLKRVALSRAQGDWRAWLETLSRQLADRPEDLTSIERELGRAEAAAAGAMVAQHLASGPTPAAQAPRLPEVTGPAQAAMDFLLARLAQRVGPADAVRPLFEKSIRAMPAFAPAAIALARLEVEAFRWQEALALLDAAGQVPREAQAEVAVLRARCHDGLDELPEAVEHYRRAIELAPSDVGTMMRLARLYERTGDARHANRQYESILEVEPKDLAAREGVVRTLWASGEQGQMMRLVEQISEMQRIDPEASATQRCLAMIKLLQPPRPDLAGYANRLRELAVRDPGDAQGREELVRTLILMRDYASARREVDELLARDVYSERGHELLSLVLIRQLDFEGAARQLEGMLKRHPNRTPWLAELARIRMFERDYDGAAAIWKHLLSLTFKGDKTGPGRDALLCRAKLMQAWRRAGRFDEARRTAQDWLAASPDPGAGREAQALRDQNRWYLLAADAAAGDTEGYLSRVRGWLASEPDSRPSRAWYLGVPGSYSAGSPGLPPGPAGLVGARRFDEAMLQILAWQVADGKNDDLAGWLVVVLQAAGRHDEAIELAAGEVAAAAGAEQRVEALNVLRGVYQRAQRYDDMLETGRSLLSELRKLVLEVEPRRQPIVEALLFEQQRMLGILMAQAKRYEDGITYLRQLIEQVDQGRREAEAIAQQSGEEPARRFQAMRQGQQARQRQAILLRALAFVHQLQGSSDQAELQGRDAYRLMPEDAGLNNDLGYTLADMGKDLSEAERMIRYAASEDPEEAAYLDSLGWVVYKRGRFEEACKWLLRATAVDDGQDPLIFDHLGDAQWRAGDREAAVRSWRQSVELSDRRRLSGEFEPDDQAADRTRRKLAAVGRNEAPDVGPVPPATQPAG